MGSSLVTGASGFLGRHLIPALAGHHETIYGLTRAARRLPGPAIPIVGDLLDPTLFLRGLHFGTVYHAAGLAHTIPQTGAENERFFAVNVTGTKNLLRALENGPALPDALVFVSSVAVYGREFGKDLDENTSRDATDPYGLSKRIAEDVVLQWGSEHGIRVGILRLPLVVGRNAPGNLNKLITAIRRRMYFGIGDGQARRSMVRARDVADILPAVAEAGGVYHLTDGYHPSFAEIEFALSRVLSVPTPPRLPIWMARGGGFAGDLLQRSLRIPAPLSSHTIRKMTSTLTFTDQRARDRLQWRPSRVLDHIAELAEMSHRAG